MKIEGVECEAFSGCFSMSPSSESVAETGNAVSLSERESLFVSGRGNDMGVFNEDGEECRV
jgi:hypothetical protein